MNKSNVRNSEDTDLFLISCFQYIFCGIILSAGPPFRQPVKVNSEPNMELYMIPSTDYEIVPLVVTVVSALLFSSYMLLDPAAWLADVMDLTELPISHRVFILLLALGGFVCSWIAEKWVFPMIVLLAGKTHETIWAHRRKSRKAYKTILEDMRM